ncbi:hypothetical protein HCX48_11725 [Rhodocyclus tenuis]|uniref:Uncharacterized protein n=2 Tax=Rhodocyclus TaxID=1064 RepID=A0A6L5JY33_RHOTE|nr:DUF6776 family protein [Rhodocyclus gracilis]MQY52257.1 hypothetical protein [Rhodocyclus gracilis]MRD73845.1 hypothetical protein [Rhodocyclus gracilis]NJA89885.1 hypothetical protein [Rhodocyclus gracilis]
MASPGATLKLRRFRRRFGIGAPRLAIRTHVEWRWRVLAGVIALLLTGALLFASFDAGRRSAGNFNAAADAELNALKGHVAALETEAAALRSIVSSGGSNLQMERAAQQQLAQQVRALESENGALKDDLAFFEGLIPASEESAVPGVRIHRMSVAPDAVPGQYRYRMLLVNNGGKPLKEFRGTLQLAVQVRQGNEDAIIAVPSEAERGAARFQIEIKHFQRVEGVFSVPPGVLVKSVESRLMQDGAVRARQTVNL